MPNPDGLARSDRKTGVPPVREYSASSLSAHETTGWKPVVHDRLEAYPPSKLTVLAGWPMGFTRSSWLSAVIKEPLQ